MRPQPAGGREASRRGGANRGLSPYSSLIRATVVTAVRRARFAGDVLTIRARDAASTGLSPRWCSARKLSSSHLRFGLFGRFGLALVRRLLLAREWPTWLAPSAWVAVAWLARSTWLARTWLMRSKWLAPAWIAWLVWCALPRAFTCFAFTCFNSQRGGRSGSCAGIASRRGSFDSSPRNRSSYPRGAPDQTPSDAADAPSVDAPSADPSQAASASHARTAAARTSRRVPAERKRARARGPPRACRSVSIRRARARPSTSLSAPKVASQDFSMLFDRLDVSRLRADIRDLSATCIRLKTPLRATWVRPMVEEQRALGYARRDLTECLVLLAAARGRIHVRRAPRDHVGEWSPDEHRARVAARLLPAYRMAEPAAVVAGEEARS